MNKTSATARTRLALLALMAVLGASPDCSWAKEYGRYDTRSLVTPNPPPAKGGRLNLEYLDAMLQDMGQHAANYPPKFDSGEDLRRAQRDAASLIGMFEAAFKPDATPDDLLLRLGALGAIGHNLDVPDAARPSCRQFRWPPDGRCRVASWSGPSTPMRQMWVA